ncbi:dGTPase [Paraburkholderia atlantica]|uniref:dGTP triphosphohydrolase n=1 Tax=Paraburkholderia atlantica TaxID=2654982 RepID=UPI003D1FFE6C
MAKRKTLTSTVPLYRETDITRESPLRDQTTFDAQDGHRSEFRRDYARLVHSPAFRRLQGKTQLFPGIESDFFRNRLTHSMEVAQIAKGIALKLNSGDYFLENPLNMDLVELAALAHDLGHPPFGHNGEYALDECMRDHGGFEGNAQTLRIVARLEKRETALPNLDQCGLNFTYRSFAALLKYDKPIPIKNDERERPGHLSKGYYASEAELVSRIKAAVSPDHVNGAAFRTVECDIMDIADDIAYSTYDLEDAFKAGFFNPLEILSYLVDTSFLERIAAKVRAANLPDVTASEVALVLTQTFGKVIADGVSDVKQSDPFNALFDIVKIYSASKRIASDGFLRTSFTSDLVKEFIQGVSIKVDHKCPAMSKIVMKRQTRLKIEALKHLTFEALTMSPRLRLVEYRGRDLVRSIFMALSADSGYMLLPDDWRQRYLALDDDCRRKRLVCDFVAGMTDRYAVEFYARLTSVDSELSFFKPF